MTNNSKPLISIITPCLNRVQFIREAIESVLSQDMPNIEHIIVDGGSTDGTLDVLAQYSHLNVVSEIDRNLYDAINKGTRMARGELIGLLNTDDLYVSNIFSEVARNFVQDPQLDALVGSALVFEDNPKGREESSYFQPSEGKSFYDWILLGALIFNAWFFRRSVFEKVGELDIQYSIAADRDFILRFGLLGLRYKAIDIPFYQYRSHPESLTIGSKGKFNYQKYNEYHHIATKYLASHDRSLEIQNVLRAWRLKSNLKAALLALSEFNIRKLLRHGIIGIRDDIQFFFILIGEVAKIGVQKIRTRS